VITFLDFELEDNPDCSWDWVMIIDGDGSILLPKTCGSDIPSPIRSHTNTAVIVFHSDHSETFRGFNITWESIKSDSACDPCSNCNGEQSKCEASSSCTYDASSDICLAPKSGVIASENYPDNYPNNFNRNYTINAEDTVVITFLDFELEDNPDCSWDWVMIIDGDGSILLPKTCGSDIPSPIRSHTNTAVIVFHSDRSETFKGFNITWESRKLDSTCDPCSNCNGEQSKCETSSGCTYDASNGICSPDNDCKCGLAKRSTRIVGGEVTEVNEYPWQVGIVTARSSFVWCGGSLVSNRWILSAAHCFEGVSASGIQALLGEHDYRDTTETTTVRMGISKIENHPDYDFPNYDFSLLKMEETISFFDYLHIRPICLPVDATNDYHGFVATVTGWGHTVSGGSNSNKLREVDVNVLKNSECKNDYGYPSNYITDQMLCANVEGGGKDSCQGDSGGPLVTAGTGDGVTAGENYELIGVVSWGDGCAEADHPGVYARVTKQLEWIYDTTQQGWSTCPRE